MQHSHRSGELQALIGSSSLDTLAQPCQFAGTPLPAYQKRARAKFLSLPLATALADLRSPLEKSYRNTVYCSDVLGQTEGKLRARYCGNRWCLVCNRIRTGRAIEYYGPILDAWPDPHFVTLTLRNCSGEHLPAMVDTMLRTSYGVGRSIHRTHGKSFRAVRKLECTYNLDRRDYHPHFHYITDGADQAELLRSLWLRRFPEQTEGAGQDVRPCDGGSTREVFKYFTKLTTRTRDGGTRRIVPVTALDTIFRALRYRRVWQPAGFTLPSIETERIEGERIEVRASPAFKRQADDVYWQWEQDVADWVDQVTGEVLSEYEPSTGYREFVDTVNQSVPVIESILQGVADKKGGRTLGIQGIKCC